HRTRGPGPFRAPGSAPGSGSAGKAGGPAIRAAGPTARSQAAHQPSCSTPMAAARRRGQRTSAVLAAVMVSSGPAALVLCHDLLGQVPGGPVGAEVGGDPVRSDFQRRVEPHAQRWPPYVPGHEPRVEDDVAPLVVGT